MLVDKQKCYVHNNNNCLLNSWLSKKTNMLDTGRYLKSVGIISIVNLSIYRTNNVNMP